MSLAIKKFINMRPQLPFRFSVDFRNVDRNTVDAITAGILNTSIKSVKVNLGESDLTKGAVYYGNGYFTIPVFNPAERTLEMSFTETDNLDILKFFDYVQDRQFNRTPVEMEISVTEYDETMTVELSKILYTCILKEYSEPAFNRTGGVNIATIDASFIIKDMKNEFVTDNTDATENARYKEVEEEYEKRKHEELIEDLKQAIFNELKNISYKDFMNEQGVIDSDKVAAYVEKEVKSKFNNASDADYIVAHDAVVDMLEKSEQLRNAVEQGNAKLAEERQKEFKQHNDTKDFNVSQNEIDNVFAEIQKSKFKGKISKEDLKTVQEENAKRMNEAYSKFEKELSEIGINVSINAYNDTGHSLGIGTKSGSHLLGQKIDLNFTSKDGKITMNNMSEEQRTKIVELARKSGLTANWETSGKDMSGWGDFALTEAKSIDKSGKVVDLHTKSWTGEKYAYNTSTKSKQAIGNT